MRRLIWAVIIIYLASCSSVDLERKTLLEFDTLFFATVKDRRSITLEANESMSGRVLVGFLAAGPIGAIATANTEDDLSYLRYLNTRYCEVHTQIRKS